VPDAAGLFSHANRARWGGDHDRALELYRTLVEWYPGSTEAHESQAVLGSMLLVDGDAGAALHCFDNYLRTGGALREDVMADRARALGRLGRAHDELQAWSDLLRAFPASVHASFASSRLRELGAR
jgi:tetratricopeptide (TPR) repeat protein